METSGICEVVWDGCTTWSCESWWWGTKLTNQGEALYIRQSSCRSCRFVVLPQVR